MRWVVIFLTFKRSSIAAGGVLFVGARLAMLIGLQQIAVAVGTAVPRVPVSFLRLSSLAR